MSNELTEAEVGRTLRFVQRGMTNEEIGFQLHIGTTAVKNRLSKLMARYGCRNRTELVQAAMSRGLLSDPTITVNTGRHSNGQYFVVVITPGREDTVASWCSKADADMLACALRGYLNASTITDWRKARGN
jgi:DNA-binding CsgD family transcriptional regulator